MLSATKVIALYCIVDALLKAMHPYEDRRVKMSDSEVLTTAFVSMLYFGGHLDNGRHFMRRQRYAVGMPDKSQFCSRLHRLSDFLLALFYPLAKRRKAIAGATDYRLGSFPVAVGDNIRISRSKILQGEGFRGKQVAMRRYFYGVRVRVLTLAGLPVQLCLVPASEHDSQAFGKLPFDVAPQSAIYRDAGYSDYTSEEAAEGIQAKVQRKSNSKRKEQP